MWHLSERNLPKNLNRLWPTKHTRPMCYSLVSHLEVHGHFIEMPTGFFPPQHQQAASKELSGLEMPNISASSYEFQRNAILTILLFCRLQACAAAPHLVSLPCGHRPLGGQKGCFLWPQMDLFMWLPSAEPADHQGYDGRVKNFNSLGTPALTFLPYIRMFI